jgi:hypothetical protein
MMRSVVYGIGSAPPRVDVSLETLKVSESRRKEQKTPDALAARPESVAGRVVHDSRGNAVWNWAIDTDVATPTGLLRALTPTGSLSLEGETAPAAPGWSGDPYNRNR